MFLILSSCGIYTFSGSSIPKDAQTITIKSLKNIALNKQPILSQVMTEKLKDFFVQRTNLTIVEEDGDLFFSGNITKYEIKPMAINSNQTAGQNRLKIEVKIVFKNKFKASNNFEENFTRYQDFSSETNLIDIEDNLIEEISKQIVEDIFNKSVVNW
tara:strand:+ start:4811 stop:5281 length:471 start_codon:yes stop_codon:yes gene_type:complete